MGVQNFPGREIRGVLFDFEGTLVDFHWKLGPAVQDTLTALSGIGFNPAWFGENPDYAAVYNITRERASSGAPDPDFSRAPDIIDAIYDRYDEDALTRWNLHDDAREVLEVLKKRGYRLGCVSNVGNTTLAKALGKLKVKGFFEIIVARRDVAYLKPHPEGLLKSLAFLKSAAQDILFVGDSINDITAARAAGMPVCYISGGEAWPPFLPKHSADLEVDTLSRILAALEIRPK